MLFRASVLSVLFKLVFEFELAEFAIIFFYQCERCVKTPHYYHGLLYFSFSFQSIFAFYILKICHSEQRHLELLYFPGGLTFISL